MRILKSILNSRLIRRIIILGFSLAIIATAIISRTNRLPGKVAGTVTNPLLLNNKFCDNPASPDQQKSCTSFIPGVLAATMTSPYQNVSGDVAISNGLIRSNYNNYGFLTSPKQFHMAENATWDPVNGWTTIQTGKGAIIQTYAQDGNYALYIQADNTSRVAGAARSFTAPFAVTMDGKTCINGDCRPAWPTGPQIQRGEYVVGGLGSGGWACTGVSFLPAFSSPPAVATSAWNTDAGEPKNADSKAVYITASGMQFCILNTDPNPHTIRGSWIATW